MARYLAFVSYQLFQFPLRSARTSASSSSGYKWGTFCSCFKEPDHYGRLDAFVFAPNALSGSKTFQHTKLPIGLNRLHFRLRPFPTLCLHQVKTMHPQCIMLITTFRDNTQWKFHTTLVTWSPLSLPNSHRLIKSFGCAGGV